LTPPGLLRRLRQTWVRSRRHRVRDVAGRLLRRVPRRLLVSRALPRRRLQRRHPRLRLWRRKSRNLREPLRTRPPPEKRSPPRAVDAAGTAAVVGGTKLLPGRAKARRLVQASPLRMRQRTMPPIFLSRRLRLLRRSGQTTVRRRRRVVSLPRPRRRSRHGAGGRVAPPPGRALRPRSPMPEALVQRDSRRRRAPRSSRQRSRRLREP